MPRRRAAWSSWNYTADPRRRALPRPVGHLLDEPLQGIADDNADVRHAEPDPRARDPNQIYRSQVYEPPGLRRRRRSRAQEQLWSLQGDRNTWFCGAYFGAGFHEDGLQAGLAVAEQLGGVRRPWNVADESGRITLGEPRGPRPPRRRRWTREDPRLYAGSVMHRRLRPRRHRLRYRVFQLLLDLDEIDALDGGCGCSRATASTCSASTTATTATARGGDLRLHIERARSPPAFDRARDGGSACSPCRASSATSSTRSASISATAQTARLHAILYEVNNTFGGTPRLRLRRSSGQDGDDWLQHGCDKQFLRLALPRHGSDLRLSRPAAARKTSPFPSWSATPRARCSRPSRLPAPRRFRTPRWRAPRWPIR